MPLMCRARLVRSLAPAVAAVAVLSCVPDGESDRVSVLGPEARASVVSCASGSVSVTPTTTDLLPVCDFGTAYVLVELAFGGSITVTPHSGEVYTTDPRGRPWGWSGCYEGTYLLSNTDGPWKAGDCTQTGPLPGPSFVRVRGNVSARWMGPIPNPPESQSTYSGAFTVSYTRVTGSGSVQADKYVVQPNGTVTFTASINPTTVGNGVQVPYSVRWRWIPDQAGGSNPAWNCGPWLVCTTNVPSSGTMYADFVINGDSSFKSVRIAVNTCPPTGDPWLDNPDFRGHLETDLQNSNPSGPDQGRQEVPGSWYTNNGTGEPIWVPRTPTAATNCSVTAPLPVIPGTTIAVETHTHPYAPLSPLAFCGTQAIPPGYGYTGGPSGTDWNGVNAASAAHGVPVTGCIIDVGNIYCYPSGVPSNQRPQNTKRYAKQSNGCYVLRP
jgi:hypothetical protein